MRDNGDSVLFLATVKAVLAGGPDDFPDTERQRSVPPDQEKVKVPHRGGYEHFERPLSGPLPDSVATDVVFYWTMRTAIAE